MEQEGHLLLVSCAAAHAVCTCCCLRHHGPHYAHRGPAAEGLLLQGAQGSRAGQPTRAPAGPRR
jgi:hypothetical protein